LSYTPKFQKLLDDIQALVDGGASEEDIQTKFYKGCLELGQEERLQNLYRIRSNTPIPGQTDRALNFTLNATQRYYYKRKTNRDLILKPRQVGFTTLACIMGLDQALFIPGIHYAIMADTKDHVKEYFQIVKFGFRWFKKDWGAFYPVQEEADNVNALKIGNTKSSLLVCTNTRGLSVDCLHIAEAAFCEDKDISDSLESVPLAGTIVLETTADTASGLFYNLWDRSQKDPAAMYTHHFFPWWIEYPKDQDLHAIKIPEVIDYTPREQELVNTYKLLPKHIAWRRLKISENNGNEDEFLRKYPEDPTTCFLSGAGSVFAPDVLANLWANEKSPSFTGDLQYDSNGKVEFLPRAAKDMETWCGYRIWTKPEGTHRYAIGADTSEGVGGDGSTFHVVDIDLGIHVATFWSNFIDPNNFAAELYKAGIYYNKAYIIPELNNTGHAVVTLLSGASGGLAYPNLFRRYEYDEFTQRKTKKIGFRTTAQTKPRIIQNLNGALRSGELRSYDRETILEMSAFVRDNRTGRMGAKGSSHDDRVMSLALAYEQVRIIKEGIKEGGFGGDTSAYRVEYDPATGFPIHTQTYNDDPIFG